jgi:hypothetical protein
MMEVGCLHVSIEGLATCAVARLVKRGDEERNADAGSRRPGNVDDACSGTTRDRGATLLRTICPGGSDKLSVTQQSRILSY